MQKVQKYNFLIYNWHGIVAAVSHFCLFMYFVFCFFYND